MQQKLDAYLERRLDRDLPQPSDEDVINVEVLSLLRQEGLAIGSTDDRRQFSDVLGLTDIETRKTTELVDEMYQELTGHDPGRHHKVDLLVPGLNGGVLGVQQEHGESVQRGARRDVGGGIPRQGGHTSPHGCRHRRPSDPHAWGGKYRSTTSRSCRMMLAPTRPRRCQGMKTPWGDNYAAVHKDRAAGLRVADRRQVQRGAPDGPGAVGDHLQTPTEADDPPKPDGWDGEGYDPQGFWNPYDDPGYVPEDYYRPRSEGMSLSTIVQQFANEWRDEEGKFARKGYIAPRPGCSKPTTR